MDAPTDDVETQDPLSEPENEVQGSKKDLLPLRPIDQQRLSHYILTQRDRPISSLESMKKFLDSPDDVDSRIEELNEQHSEDLDRLYTALTEEYLDEAEDRYYAFDEKVLPDDDIQALYWDLRGENSNPKPEWDYMVAHTAYVYHTRMDEITRHIKLRERNQKLAEMDFPRSIEEYRQKPKDTQHRAARFLVLESDEQREKMLSEFSWAWRQVTPLRDEFQANQEFQDEIRATIAELNNVGDPRKR
ncbi:hypothetical protein MVEN_01375100 [Mycena venus]|uniref:Uncharacterized protein n=1 Tax=Mycena venus TaxID=2733690 RepID=A0A8H6XYK0_9AGAR|nr:hypothetical protein MVEN_01375100 [Mycena venus]